MADQNQIEALYQKGFDARCAGRYGEARLYLESVLNQEPGHIRARHQMGLIQGFEGDFDGSLETLQTLSTQDPNDLDVRYDLAMTQMMLGMNDEAAHNFGSLLP